MEFQNQMLILTKLTMLSVFIMTWGYSLDCTYTIRKLYFNEHILTFYLDSFDNNNIPSQVDIFSYEIIPEGDNCSETSLTINYTLKIYAPGIGLTSYETFYIGSFQKNIGLTTEYFRNSDFSFLSGSTPQAEKLISYISQSGKLPNGEYLFQFVINNNLQVLSTISEPIEINRPIGLELLSPGGTLSELNNSYTYSTVPLFTWYSDFCRQCTYGIRVCEYNHDEHSSLNNALDDWPLLPYDHSNEFHEPLLNPHSFQYPAEGNFDMEVGKHYVWQIRRSYETTLETHYDYSPIYIFEVRSTTKEHLDFTDPYLLAIQSLIGDEQYNLWFSTGGELEQFVIAGESIWINDEEVHIDVLYSIVSELNLGEITIEKIQIK